MSTYLNYLVEANLGLAAFLLLYWLLLRNETDFGYKRVFLLVSIAASLVFPLFHISTAGSAIPAVGNMVPSYWLPEVIVGDGATPATQTHASTYWSAWQIVMYVYLSGVAFFFMRFVIQLFSIWHFCQGARFSKYNERFYIVESPRHLPTFSFFNIIFIGNTDDLGEDDKESIVLHELVHAKQWHSIDVLTIELLRIAFWFNPVVHRLKNMITQLHEFQADQQATATRDVQQYCSLLARVALQSAGLPLANHFNRSLTVKRINMMKTLKRKVSKLKLAAFVPALAAFFFVVACQDQVMQEVADSTLSQVAEYPAIVQKDIDSKYRIQFPDAKFTYLEGEVNELRERMKTQNAGQILLNTYSFEDRGVIGVLLKDITQTQATGDEVFIIVEESAQYPGGMTAFYEYIKGNVHYPEAAKAAAIEGRVFVEFVVNTDGSVSDVVVKKGIGHGCDEEAIRVLENSPNWTPGTQRGKKVRQRMVLPVVFSSTAGVDQQSTGRLEQSPYDMKVIDLAVEETNGATKITGKVIDQDGNVMPGMNVILAGTTTGTVSNRDGTFSITTTSHSGKLVFSFVGYNSKEISF